MEQTLTPSPILLSADTIVAVSTPQGTGGIAVIRVSGPDSFKIVDSVWEGKQLSSCKSHTAHWGRIRDEKGEVLDEVVATVFRSPRSYTGQDTVEISCHGSRWIQREIVNLLIRTGARPAGPGEFSQQAFLNGKIDLAQAEGIVDLIASDSRAAHRLAMTQANGVFSRRLEELRTRLIDFASLLELELDFSEEDVEFADRERLRNLADTIIREVNRLVASYSTGKAFKEGLPVVIAGHPNAGKSTLLNHLLEEDKAIVSDVPGTTRDIIEDTRELGGVLFRFVDTAGLHATDDTVERIGISRATDRIKRAAIVIWMLDLSSDIPSQVETIKTQRLDLPDNAIQFLICNKIDVCADVLSPEIEELASQMASTLSISASEGTGIDRLTGLLVAAAEEMQGDQGEIMVTNARHYDALVKGRDALVRARGLLDANLSADFIAQDVREALHHLGEITGAITTSTLLESIFTRFCIGK